MFISEYKDFEQHIMWSNGVIEPMASFDDKTQYYLQTFSTLGGAELLNKMDTDVSYACKCAIELLNSVPPVAGEYDVICLPDVTGLIAHEAFGHGVEMDMFVKERALAKNYINKQIASPLVTMHDNAATCNESGSYFFDDEGTISSDTVIIEKGILKSGINDLQSAIFLGVNPTGNGRRESYERKAYTRMTNTYFEAGNDTLEDMIASIDYGILLENGSSGMEDPKNWGIQCMVNIGREIKNGKLTGKIFSPICLSGYVPDLLNSISMISDDLHLSGCGYCGKGYKEWVKVSDGGPAIKTRVNIS
jgi:TldD protein